MPSCLAHAPTARRHAPRRDLRRNLRRNLRRGLRGGRVRHELRRSRGRRGRDGRRRARPVPRARAARVARARRRPQTGAAPGPSPSGERSETLTHDGVARNYMIHVPASYDGNAPVPLVLDIHGLTSNASQQAAISGWRAKADREGFVVIWPNGLDSSWNGGSLCCGMSLANHVDDEGFCAPSSRGPAPSVASIRSACTRRTSPTAAPCLTSSPAAPPTCSPRRRRCRWATARSPACPRAPSRWSSSGARWIRWSPTRVDSFPARRPTHDQWKDARRLQRAHPRRRQ